MKTFFFVAGGLGAWFCGGAMALAQGCPAVHGPVAANGAIDLPTSKQIVGAVPGAPQQTNTLPISIAVSPDGKWVVTTNGGYGTCESRYMQSMSVMEAGTGRVVDYPDARTLVQTDQILYSGLAFSGDGKHLYASMASATDPEGKTAGNTGSGVAVYGFEGGKVVPEGVLKMPLEPLAAGRKTKLMGDEEGAVGVPYPASIAVVEATHRGEAAMNGAQAGGKLLVADNFSDMALVMDAATGKVLQRFDLSESETVPGVYPGVVAVSKDGSRGFVALWNASEVVELDLKTGKVGRRLALLKAASPVAASSHPSAMVVSPDGETLYVTLANRDAVAAVDLAKGGFRTKGFFDVRLPHQTYYGAQPESVALNADGSRMYVANMGSDAVAVFETNALTKAVAAKGMVEPKGFVPTEWLPMGVAVTGGKLYVATGKGKGTGPNNFPQGQTPETAGKARYKLPSTYIATLLYGSLASLDLGLVEKELPKFTEETLVDNRMKAAEEKIAFAGGKSPIQHVIYIIKENRTYDQVFGDLAVNGKPVGNGDKSLTMYGEDVTPNEHKLVLQFGVLDNFYDSGEVSGDGHVWSTAAIGSDYLERAWENNYRGRQHAYDFEGLVSLGYPILQKIPDVNEPGSGYLWGNLAAHGKTLMHFGEFISSTFCSDKKINPALLDPTNGPMAEGASCSRTAVKPGEMLPAVWGGGKNIWPWSIPLLAANVPTKPELVGHYAPEAPDFNLQVPDQVRADIFMKHLEQWKADRAAGKDTMPNFVLLRLGNDHTAGTTPGGPTPKSSVADNDLAVGRVVEAVSHSAYWEDTALFILEDDAQAGADHVDAHRSLGIVVSKYAPHGKDGMPVVDSRFYSTVSMIRTMETVLGLPPMNNNDAFSSLIGTLFTGAGDQPAYVADARNRENGLIYTANKASAVGAKESSKMDFRHADHADPQKLNVILWKDAMGEKPVPAMLLAPQRKMKKDDDD